MSSVGEEGKGCFVVAAQRGIILCCQLVFSILFYLEVDDLYDIRSGFPLETKHLVIQGGALGYMIFSFHGAFLVLGAVLEGGSKGVHLRNLASADTGVLTLMSVSLPLLVLSTQYDPSDDMTTYTTLMIVLFVLDFSSQVVLCATGKAKFSPNFSKRLFMRVYFAGGVLFALYMTIYGYKADEKFNGINFEWVVALQIAMIIGSLDSDALGFAVLDENPDAKKDEIKMELPGSKFMMGRVAICSLGIVVTTIPYCMYIFGFCDRFFHSNDDFTRVICQMTIYSLLVSACLMCCCCCLLIVGGAVNGGKSDS